MTEQIQPDPCRFSHESLKKLIGMRATVRYIRESGRQFSRTGEIASIGFRNVSVITVSGRAFRIPVAAVIDVEPPDGAARGGKRP